MPLGSKQKRTADDASASSRHSKAAAPKRGGKAKRFVLLIGDEGAILVYMEGSKVVRRLFAPTPHPSSTEAMAQLMQTNPHVPISILVDSMDQQYVRQSFPPVSSLSVGGLVKRRLDRDFQTEDLKGFLPLGRDKTGRKEWNFLLISLTKTALLTEWIDLVIELPNELKGIYVVPIESMVYLRMLSKVTGSSSPKSWQLLVTHNKVSGFRQVVSNNGKLVFTRVTQAIDDAIPAVIAGNIEQEIINTIEYLRRLGFQDNAGLDMVVIAAADVNEVLDLKRFNLGNTQSLTPLDVADALGLDQAALSADRFGDVVMASAFLRSKKHILKFSTAYANTLSKLYSIRKALKIGAIMAALLILALSAQNVLGSIENKSLMQSSMNKHAAIKGQMEELKTRVEGLNKNLAYKSAVVSTYDAYIKDNFNPTEFMAALGQQLTPEYKLLNIEWLADKAAATKTPTTPVAVLSPVSIRAEFELKGDYADVDALAKAATGFVDTLASAMPQYAVTHEPFPWQKDSEKGMEISFDQQQKVGIKDENNKLTVLFSGPQKPEPTSNPKGVAR